MHTGHQIRALLHHRGRKMRYLFCQYSQDSEHPRNARICQDSLDLSGAAPPCRASPDVENALRMFL